MSHKYLTQSGHVKYNPFQNGSSKYEEYEKWCRLMDSGRHTQADEIFKENNSGMSFEERNGQRMGE